VSGWIVAAWSLGALGIVLSDARLSRGELLSLAVWPITAPLFVGLRKWRHWRYSCPEHGYFGDREHYARHLALSHTRVPSTSEGEGT
jgi:hypothetical protein